LPAGSTASLVAGSSDRDRTLTPDVPGVYSLSAIYHDANGVVIASPTLQIVVADITRLRVELTWRTTGDPDESDLSFRKDASLPVGSELDLHLLHASAHDTFFAPLWDCDWQMPAPLWRTDSHFGDLHLLADDYDGGGPEVIAMPAPERGVRYTVGVHHWRDGGFGSASATLRIYLNDALVDEWADVDLAADASGRRSRSKTASSPASAARRSSRQAIARPIQFSFRSTEVHGAAAQPTAQSSLIRSRRASRRRLVHR